MCFIEQESFSQGDFAHVDQVKARKAHRCEECNDVIVPGELHMRRKVRFDGEFSSWRTCMRCEKLIEMIATFEMEVEGCGAFEAYPPVGYLRQALPAYGLTFDKPAHLQKVQRNHEIETQDIGF